MSRTLTRSLIAGLAIMAASSTIVSADEIDRRQNMQERRIQQGVRDGSVTRSEYIRLEQEQARIRELERRAKADGRVDRYEAAQIGRAQQEASRHIYQEKHDREGRSSGWGFRRWW